MKVLPVLMNLALMSAMLLTAYFFLDMKWLLDPFIGVLGALGDFASN